jgi:hypothetical protein
VRVSPKSGLLSTLALCTLVSVNALIPRLYPTLQNSKLPQSQTPEKVPLQNQRLIFLDQSKQFEILWLAILDQD